MIQNRLRELRERNTGLSQGAFVTNNLCHMTRENYSLMEVGKVLPTAADMMIICEVHREPPLNIWQSDDIDLIRVDRAYRNQYGDGNMMRLPLASREKKSDGNPAMRIRVPPAEQAQLLEDIAALGYKDYREWHERMREVTHSKRIREAKRLQMGGKKE